LSGYHEGVFDGLGLEFVMKMTRLGYFAEFYLFPPFLMMMTAVALVREPSGLTEWLLAAAVGVSLWTLIEYILHRGFFHHVPIVSEMHERHHEEPLELIGSPAWLSLLFGIALVLLPLWKFAGLPFAIGMLTGISGGYLWYSWIHYAAHHITPQPGTYLYRVRMHHARHHYAHDMGNFGVTTDFWDKVFGTALGRDGRKTWSAWIANYWSRRA
jgi:sterol desaturase/sphingolipid hydroxylase (fatty acid hydroxylase superfamily)